MKTMEELYSEMKEAFAQKTGMALSNSGDLAVRLWAVAAQVYALYLQSDWVVRQCFPQTADGEMLDRHAALRGLERRQAVPAVGTLRFYVDEPAAAACTIAAGTVCMTGGLVRFETTREAVLAVGETQVDVPAQAVEPGSGGNAAAGTVVRMSVAPVGIAGCTNPEAFTGGLDEEDDETLRNRILETFRRMPNGANGAFYEQEAMAFGRVVAAQAIPRSRGIGTVDVVAATAEGIPEEELLEEIRTSLEKKREIAVDVQVVAPESVPVEVSVQVAAADGADVAALKTAVEETLRSKFDGRLLGQPVLRAELGNLIYQVAGVANYRLLKPEADVAITVGQLPRLGSLTVEVTA